MHKVISIDYRIGCKEVSNILFDEANTFLDADILVIDPSRISRFWDDRAVQMDDGSKRFFSRHGSDKIRYLLSHRKTEMETILANGKIVFVFCSPMNTVNAEVRNEREFQIMSNYDWLPFGMIDALDGFIIQGRGSTINLKQKNHPIAPYFEALKSGMEYLAYLKPSRSVFGEDFAFLENKSKNPVGFMLQIREGYMVFVPPPPNKTESEKILGVLIKCAKPLLTKDFRSPSPPWVKNFSSVGIDKLGERLTGIQTQLEGLGKDKQKVEDEIEELESYKLLLYEQGKLLEDIVIKSFALLGFSAGRYKDADLEHDVVLKSEEGVAIAEVEGRDNDSIHIDKLDQLTRVVDEDFNNRGSYAHGILIGNHFRLKAPSERGAAFTEKVYKAAERKRFALLTTIELFNAVQKILEKPNDENLKKVFRETILNTEGTEIHFPVS